MYSKIEWGLAACLDTDTKYLVCARDLNPPQGVGCILFQNIHGAYLVLLGECVHHIDPSGKCRPLAVGNTIVWEMSEEEIQRVIGEYRNR